MRSALRRIFGGYRTVAFAVTTAILVLALAAPAFAVDDPAAVTVEGGVDQLETVLLQVATYALPVAAGLLAIVFGWKMARKFLRV